MTNINGVWVSNERAQDYFDRQDCAEALREYNRNRVAEVAEFAVCTAIIIGLLAMTLYAFGGLR